MNGRTPSHRIAELKRALSSRSGGGAKYGLDRLLDALEALDHPERSLPCVHVAGTNGKGSVCAMLEAICRAAGLSTGVFTSPHLCRLNERIRIDGHPIDDAAFAEALSTVMAPSTPWVTFFEAMTLAALIAMRRVDLGIVEAGLGGRLDATNVIDPPRAAAIVSISRDHTRILGDDLASIAREKAGIFKPGTAVVLGPLPSEAFEMARSMAHQAGAPSLAAVVRSADRAPAMRALGVEPTVVERCPDGLRIAWQDRRVEVAPSLEGPYQADNAAVAATLAWTLGLDDADVAAGLAAARWPGRFERIDHRGTTVLFDCAHNVEGARALASGLGDPDPERTVLVFGAMDDKPWEQMLDTLAPFATRRIYAEPLKALGNRGPADPETLAARHGGEAATGPEDALSRALAEAGERIVVAGSIFLVGAARAWLLDVPRDVLLPL